MAELQPVKGLSYRHEAIIDYMLANPDMNKGEIAEALGYTVSYFSILINSDLFQAEFRARRDEFSETLSDRTQRKLFSVTEKAAKVVEEQLSKLDEEGGLDCDPKFALDAMDRALHRLGFAPQRGGPLTVNAQNAQVNIPGAVPLDVYQRAKLAASPREEE